MTDKKNPLLDSIRAYCELKCMARIVICNLDWPSGSSESMRLGYLKTAMDTYHSVAHPAMKELTEEIEARTNRLYQERSQKELQENERIVTSPVP